MKKDYSKCRLLIFSGRGPVSLAIRWVTRGPYSHVALLGPEESDTIYESWQGAGVRKKRIDDWEDIHVFKIPLMTDEMWEKAINWFVTQLGRKYDYKAIGGFLSRRAQKANGKWICSEIGFDAIRRGGLSLLNAEAWKVSPNILAFSPLIERDYEFEESRAA
jgi:uncharacterized protein YycO